METKVEDRSNSVRSVFFSFIKPYLALIDSGKLFREPFGWFYMVFAILNLLFPFYMMYEMIKNGIFDAPFKLVIGILLIWLVIVLVCWISFQLWWDRKSKISTISAEGVDFIATPVYSHFIQTLGEWIGTAVAVVGFCGTLLAWMFLAGNDMGFLELLPIDFDKLGIAALIIFPIVGFFIIITSRFAAEQFRALAAIANNTRKD